MQIKEIMLLLLYPKLSSLINDRSIVFTTCVLGPKYRYIILVYDIMFIHSLTPACVCVCCCYCCCCCCF